MASLRCIVVTPEETSLEETVDFVALPLFDGEIGIGAGHSPLIGRLGYGEMRLKASGNTQRFYLDGGFVQVADNVVSILTGRAVPAADVDPTAAENQLATARNLPANSPELMEIRDRQISQARAQIRLGRGGETCDFTARQSTPGKARGRHPD